MNIYVANFDTKWNDENLKAIFTPYGEVQSATVSLDGFTGLSRGFGFVEMPQEQEATAAIKALNGSEVNGNKLSVKIAEPRLESKGSYKVGTGGINPYRFKKS